MKTNTVSLFTAALWSLCLNLGAQDGELPGEIAFQPEGKWYEVNGEAWDAAVSKSSERMLGTWSDNRFTVGLTYESEDVFWGTKVGGKTLIPRVTWDSPLFGGEAYTDFEMYSPFESEEADRYYIVGGWKYYLTPRIVADIGGNFLFTDKKVFGPGIAHRNYGFKESGNVYLGFMLDALLQPSATFFYDFQLEMSQVEVGLNHDFDLSDMLIEGFSLECRARAGHLSARSWTGRNGDVNGRDWENSYGYIYGTVDLVYRPCRGVRMFVGGRGAMNNDGEGPAGPGLLFWLGPDSMAWFGGGASYEF